MKNIIANLLHTGCTKDGRINWITEIGVKNNTYITVKFDGKTILKRKCVKCEFTEIERIINKLKKNEPNGNRNNRSLLSF